MEQKNFTRGLAFTLLFAALGTIANFIPLAKILGMQGSTFSAFDLIAPIPVAFLGLSSGLAAILIAKLSAGIATGAAMDASTFLRLLPPLGAGLFFWSYKHDMKHSILIQAAIPALAMVAFIFNPAIFGTSAMAYALFWLIPIAVIFLPDYTYLRSLGATFCQHAIGSVLFLYTIPALQNPQIWLALIPIVVVERLLFALGITISFKAIALMYDKFHFVIRTQNNSPSPMPAPQKKEKN
ncbi:MAG: hypothetical protein WC492_02155 [Candidatus Micrarchaeia archaeon]